MQYMQLEINSTSEETGTLLRFYKWLKRSQHWIQLNKTDELKQQKLRVVGGYKKLIT